jgi:hypothetical protein
MLLIVEGDVFSLTLSNTATIIESWTHHFREVDILANVCLEIFSVSFSW